MKAGQGQLEKDWTFLPGVFELSIIFIYLFIFFFFFSGHDELLMVQPNSAASSSRTQAPPSVVADVRS